MSSLLRSFPSASVVPYTAQFVVARFTNSDGNRQPFPWRFNKTNQTIDLEFVDGFTNTTTLSSDDMFFRGQKFGSANLVLGLGPNFINWCENSDNFGGGNPVDAGSVELYEKPYVVAANGIALNMNPGDAESGESTDPISFESSAGSSAGKYCKTLIFVKPMVIKYTVSGTTYYRWFFNNFEGNT